MHSEQVCGACCEPGAPASCGVPWEDGESGGNSPPDSGNWEGTLFQEHVELAIENGELQLVVNEELVSCWEGTMYTFNWKGCCGKKNLLEIDWTACASLFG